MSKRTVKRNKLKCQLTVIRNRTRKEECYSNIHNALYILMYVYNVYCITYIMYNAFVYDYSIHNNLYIWLWYHCWCPPIMVA